VLFFVIQKFISVGSSASVSSIYEPLAESTRKSMDIRLTQGL